jgi:hypothetical protein
MRNAVIGVSESELLNFIRLIVAGDSNAAKDALRKTPALATQPVAAGATRSTAREYFFNEMLHYLAKGDTALHMAAAAYQVPIAKMLIAKGADPRARNRLGAEPLHYACDGVPGSKHWNPKAQAAVIKLLIKARANPNAFNKLGVAPLHLAVRNRCAAAVKALLAGGANPKLKNKSGSTPAKLAMMTTGRGGSGSQEAKAQQAIIVRLLPSAGG